MSDKTISYGSVNDAIDDAVAKYKNHESIDDILQWVNHDTDRLTAWAYDTDAFGASDAVFLFCEDEIFFADGDIFDCFDAEDLDLTLDRDILGFINRRVDGLIDEALSVHFQSRDGVCMDATIQIFGQGGAHYSNFGICSSQKECFKHLLGGGTILWGDACESHSNTDLILMYKKNITEKYFEI
jgi:hypothetical protein